MINKYKKIVSCLLFLFIVSACDKKFDFEDYDVTLANLFSGYGDDIDKDIIFLNDKINIKKSLLNASKNDTLEKIDLLITTYYDNLNQIDLESQRLKKNMFYDKDILTEEGKIFKLKSEKFLTDVNMLLKHKDLNDYLNYYFNVDDVKNNDDMYAIYMEYHYLGIPYPVFKYLIKKRKYDLQLFKNEILSMYIQKNSIQ